MNHEEAFIQAIRQTPNDDAPRLIYADWLEEHGQADRAEIIRIQCQLARIKEEEPEDSILLSRAENLLRGHWEEWVGPIRAIVGPWRDRYGERWMGEEFHPDGLRRFRRGFIDSLGLYAKRYLRDVETLNRLVPLRELRLWGAGRCAERLSNEPGLAGLSILSFTDYYEFPVTAQDAAALAKSPYLYNLSALYLGRNSLGDEGVEALVTAPWLLHVTTLDLSDNGLSDRALRALAKSPNVANLRNLFLQNNHFTGVADLVSLINSPSLRDLTHLEHDPPYGNINFPTTNVFLPEGSERP